MQRRSFLQGIAGLPLLSRDEKPPVMKSSMPVNNKYNLYWGDIHTHCNISYGHGSMKDALEAALEQLDFCSVVPHAFWHDAPRGDQRLKDIVDYCDEAFERVKKNWKNIQALNVEYRKPGKFIPFLGYEWHSMAAGDHNVYYLEPYGQLTGANSIEELRSAFIDKKALLIPHHMGYVHGYRGYDWDTFADSGQTPFVEVFSRHGCSESDTAPYPMLHTMGPRSHEGTIREGLERGHKFGFIASTDHHAGYPGTYGDGRIAAYAEELTAESLWKAFTARRVFGTTGEKIIVDFRLNDAYMGEEVIHTGKRRLYVHVEGNDFLDYVEIVKNGQVFKKLFPANINEISFNDPLRVKLRIEWGWGRNINFTEWNGKLSLTDGKILSVTPCFRGLPVLSKYRGDITEEQGTKVSRILDSTESSCAFQSYTVKNPNTLTPTTCSIVLDVLMPRKAVLKARMNGQSFSHSLEELLSGTRSHFTKGWLSEAVVFHRAVPQSGFILEDDFTDTLQAKRTDYYYIRVRQLNNQWAWSSPIWITA